MSWINGVSYTKACPERSLRDDAGNRTSKQNLLTGVTENYTYDPIYQLTKVMQGANTTESYSYDRVGNRLNDVLTGNWQYDASNQLTSTPSATYTYDNNGNMLTKSDTNGVTQYAWDYENRLTSVTLPNGGGAVTFNYDPFGRRIEKVTASATTIYAYDGANIVGEYDAAGELSAKYVQGAGIDEPLAMWRGGTVGYYQADGLGSITAVIDGTRTPLATYTYDAFGKRVNVGGQLTNSFQYTGREWDQETGLYYYRARYFDPQTGRFVSEDPILLQVLENGYSYAWNEPSTYSDPSGFDPFLDPTALINLLFHLLHPDPKPQRPGSTSAGGSSPFHCTIASECRFAPEMQHSLECFQTCIGRNPTITCGRGRHKATDPHMRGLGADLGRGSNPWLSRDKTKDCFKNCFPGTSYAQEEWNDHDNHDKGTHFHIQYSSGRGGASGFAPGIK